jgi:hypothetical protein
MIYIAFVSNHTAAKAKMQGTQNIKISVALAPTAASDNSNMQTFQGLT